MTGYLFDGAEVVQEDTGATTRYVRGLGNQAISRQQGTSATPSYYHYDQVGSVVGLSNSTGSLTDSYSYDAFGNQRARTGPGEHERLHGEWLWRIVRLRRIPSR